MTFRKCFEVIGYADDGSLYCSDCFNGNREEASPVFLGDEYDLKAGDVCEECLQFLDGHEPYEGDVE